MVKWVECEDFMDTELLKIIEPYKPPRFTGKKFISNPCKWCGWNESEEIHKNVELRGKGGPYHQYEAKQTQTGAG